MPAWGARFIFFAEKCGGRLTAPTVGSRVPYMDATHECDPRGPVEYRAGLHHPHPNRPELKVWISRSGDVAAVSPVEPTVPVTGAAIDVCVWVRGAGPTEAFWAAVRATPILDAMLESSAKAALELGPPEANELVEASG